MQDGKIVDQWLFKGLKNTLWADNLRKKIKAKGKSLSKISEKGFIERRVDQYNIDQQRKYAFQKRKTHTEINLLRAFIQDGDTHPDFTFNLAQKQNLCMQLECFKYHLGRDKNGKGIGHQLYGQEDIEHLFPSRNLAQIFVEKGWVTPQMHNGRQTGTFFLTPEGFKLPKVKHILKIKQQSAKNAKDAKFTYIEEE